MINTQFAKKEDRLQESARKYLQTGQFKEYCEIMFKLGNYKKALAFAPSVSIEYWEDLYKKYTKILEEKESNEAVYANIVSNQCDKAVKLLEQQEDYEDAKIVKAMQLTGVFKSVLTKIKSKQNSQI